MNRSSRAVAVWLYVCAFLVFSMVVVGGVTRLTRSGLSIVDWRPITGWLPPLDEAAWQAEFEKYQQFPEFQKINRQMSREEFKSIFLMEYAHRLLGRVIGLVYLFGFLWFLMRRALSRRLMLVLLGLFLLGGLQGLLGWFMVKSGLVSEPRVSQYRLAAHLMAAVALYIALLQVGHRLWTAGRTAAGGPTGVRGLRRGVGILVGLVLLMIASGAFVAGTRAGHAYNTFPMMGDRWVPEGLFALAPGWKNLFENMVTIQFTHRVLAVVIGLYVLRLWWVGIRSEACRPVRNRFHLLLLALLLQWTLGVITLLLVVPVPLGAAHQAGALLLLTSTLQLRWSLPEEPAG